MRQRLVKWVALVIAVIASFYIGTFAWQKLRPIKISSAPFVTQIVNDLTVNLILKAGRVVFNIKGNDYRLVAAVQYQAGVLVIRFFGTHAEYDRIDAETV